VGRGQVVWASIAGSLDGLHLVGFEVVRRVQNPEADLEASPHHLGAADDPSAGGSADMAVQGIASEREEVFIAPTIQEFLLLVLLPVGGEDEHPASTEVRGSSGDVDVEARLRLCFWGIAPQAEMRHARTRSGSGST